jgi:hypothetical protein
VLWLRARRAMFDPNPNEISNQTLIPNDAWNDGSCVSDHERLESGAVQNWLGARVRAVLYIATHRGAGPLRPKGGEGRSGAARSRRNVLLIPPGREPEAMKSTLCRLYLIIALTASHLTISYVRKGRCGPGRLTQPP